MQPLKIVTINELFLLICEKTLKFSIQSTEILSPHHACVPLTLAQNYFIVELVSPLEPTSTGTISVPTPADTCHLRSPSSFRSTSGSADSGA